MKKETFYKVAIAILLVLNILQLIPFLLNARKVPKFKDNLIDVASKEMRLSKEQKAKFINFAEIHRDKMETLNKEQLKLTSLYFKTPNDSLLNVIATVEMQKINATEQHFSEIKSIIESSQLDGFNKFKEEALKSILKSPPHKRLK